MAETYARMLTACEEQDFVEACDRILWEDEWFPTIARLNAVIRSCESDRLNRDRTFQLTVGAARDLVCGSCHGSRFVRRGGYSPINVLAGDVESRVVACPDCTTNDRYDAAKEAGHVNRHGGVRNPNASIVIDRDRQNWPDALREYRKVDGGMDMQALYRLSRELRGLDPDGDDRPKPVAGFKTFSEAA